MSAEWRKILISGSNAHVATITASVMGAISEDTEVVFRHSSTGRFFSSGSDFNVKYTSSNGGQLYLDNIGLTTYNISASGTPNNVQDNSQILFWHPSHGGLQATSSLFYDADTNQIQFIDGTFSGSFTGDGSGLTGVVGTLPNPLTNANGIISSSGEDFSYNGTDAVTVTVYTASNGGLEFSGGGLKLASSLAGAGLYFPSASTNNYSTMSINLAPNSGLDTGSSGLTINSNIAGDGLAYSIGILSVDLATNSGLTLVGSSPNAELRLASTLPGDGLQWADAGQYDELEIDPSFVVTSSATVTFKTGSTNILLTSDGTAVPGGFEANLIDNPTFTYDLNTTLTGDFTFQGDLYVEGNFTVTGSLVSASFETENLNIADQFILLNSGSNTGDGGFIVSQGSGNGAFMFYDSDAQRWGVSVDNVAVTTTNLSVTGSNATALVTTKITSDSEATVLVSTPTFGSNDSDKQGQLIITTAPATNESSVYIYA